MKKGDVIIRKGTGFIGEAITAVTDSDWSHVGLAINENEIIEAHPEGVRIVTKKEFIDESEHYLIARPKNVDVDKLVIDALKFNKKAYSFIQIILSFICLALETLFFLPYGSEITYDPKGVVCTELIGKVFKKQKKIIKENVKPNMLQPVHFAENTELFDYGKINQDW